MVADRIEGADLSAVSPEEFATLVKQASSSELDQAMSDGAVRTRVLDEIFNRMGSRYTGDGKTSGVIHWNIRGGPDGGADFYETVLADGSCAVNREATRDPRVTVNVSGPDFLKLASGNAAPMMMFFSGKLRVSGDIAFAAGLGNLFDIPKA